MSKRSFDQSSILSLLKHFLVFSVVFSFLLSTTFLNQVNAEGVDIGSAFKLGQGDTGVGDKFKTWSDLVTPIINNSIILASIILFFLILFGGFTIVTNAGNGQKQAEGKTVVTYSIIGFIIVFAAYWLMQIVSFMLFGDVTTIFNSGI